MSELDTLLDEATSGIERITERLDEGTIAETVERGTDALAGAEGSDGILEDVEAVMGLLDEAEAVLESIDFSELPDAIDEDEVLEAIDTGEIPNVLEESEDPDVVDLRKLIAAINVRKFLEAADVGDLWEAKRGVEAAADELTGDGEEGETGVVERAASAVAGDEEGDGEDEGVVERAASAVAGDGELLDADVGQMVESSAREAMGDFDPGDGDLGAYEAIIQQQAIEGVDAFRDALLRTHGALEAVVEENRERTRNIDRSTNSRNPTAVSTIVTSRADLASTPNYSTMPRSVRHSNGPTRKQIYGARFERERKKRGYQ